MKLIAAGIVVGFAVGLVAGVTINGWRLEKDIELLKRNHAEKLADAVTSAAQRQTEMEDAKNAVLEQSQTQAEKLAADAARAKSERDRLRRDLQAGRTNIPNATCAATADYAQTLNDVFAECVEEYTAVAGAADAHAFDTERLFQSWKAVKSVK